MEHPVLWNLNWNFYDHFEENYKTEDDEGKAVRVNLPHTVKELPLSYFSHNETAMISTYAKELTLSEEPKERLILVFDGVMACFELYVNGRLVGEHKGGYSRSMFDITDQCQAGKNRVVLKVDSREREDIPPFGYAIDYMTYGGIYRDVWLYRCGESFISQVLARYDLKDGKVTLRPELLTDNRGQAYEGTVQISLLDVEGKLVHSYEQKVQVGSGKGSCVTLPEPVGELKLWNPKEPYLYTVEVRLEKENGTVDVHRVRTGFRTVDFRPEGLFINGNQIKIMGLNRHQSFPYMGYAMGKRAQEKDAELLKEFLNVNTVRTSHYMQSEYFLDKCDEVGLLVFSEIPGWGFIGGDGFKQVMLEDVESMILTQYNHPAVFIWSIRINESLDDDELYEKANALAHGLDASRPTTGVRYISNSHLLEDVYALNDFTYSDCDLDATKLFRGRSEATGLLEPVPFMITEFSGTAFPTKAWDSADKRTTHARAYARVLNQSCLSKEMAGIIGWCAFDYNTHGDYGSGDKICYHGVMDMFRIPKYAAYVFRSQKDPDEEIVMEPTTEFSRGDNKGNRLVSPFMVLTNCDYIEVEMYGKAPVRYYPDSRYIGLAHPPIEIEEEIGVWQDLWQDGKITGYYKGKPVAVKRFLRDSCLADLEVTADDQSLYGDYVDATRIVCRMRDEAGTTLVYFKGVLQIKTEGNIEVIGPDILPVSGGYGAFWIKTRPGAFSGSSEPAKVLVRLLNTGVEEKAIEIRLEKSGMDVG
ncbi:glycoside hydrolase family 2 protein [Lacrimispora sp. 210928-DFI.3.58]|uniref:glycoside hydrolase family 2 protein n=1 Tax=Lacrimispora sp. 210928-DFI.3.58 TaxID=2883214 RepID=UPI001D090FF0|nr:glycoside hydrolase family 2 TIM barrel-domain containing protein [Lacrimispora sp. 210928-DFI.3.58]MCB7317479.1 glycoside hydrolase family 2 protein [Lacrimispora sp. 210928-DFI.3.58]